MLKRIPDDITRDATPLGLEINQLIIIIILFIAELFFYLGRGKILKGTFVMLITIGPLYIMFKEDGFKKISDFMRFIKSSKKETAESFSDYSELDEISKTDTLESVFSEVLPEVNFGALEEAYREQLAMEFAANTYEITTYGATVRLISYSSTEPLDKLGDKLKSLDEMTHINDQVKEIYRKRISKHSEIADNAVKTNYVVRVDRPIKTNEAWEDMLPMGDIIGPNLVKKHQEKQWTPIPILKRGEK